MKMIAEMYMLWAILSLVLLVVAAELTWITWLLFKYIQENKTQDNTKESHIDT